MTFTYERASVVIPPVTGTPVKPELPEGQRIVDIIRQTTGSDPNRYDVLLETEVKA